MGRSVLQSDEEERDKNGQAVQDAAATNARLVHDHQLLPPITVSPELELGSLLDSREGSHNRTSCPPVLRHESQRGNISFVSRHSYELGTYSAQPDQDSESEEGRCTCKCHKRHDTSVELQISSDSNTALVLPLQPTGEGNVEESGQTQFGYDTTLISILRPWWKEWALLLVSVGIIIAIAFILRSYNQQPQPNWRLGLNLNTLIALLASLLRSSLVTVVEEVVSQAKWSWQRQRRPLQDLAYFDEASRGPLGALSLFFKVPDLLISKLSRSRISHSTVTACLVMILSLAIGAFTQQAIRTVPCSRPVPGNNASIPVARYAQPIMNESEFNWSQWEFDAATKARIVGAFGGPNSTRPTFLQDCTTGNCTFESLNDVTHVTSGFCSRCVETTNFLVSERNVPHYFEGVNYPIKFVVRLPSSPSLMLAQDLDHGTRLGLAVNVDSNPLEAMSGSAPSDFTVAINIASITRANCSPDSNCSGLWPRIHDPHDADSSAEWADFNVVSVSCGLYPCAQHLKAEASNGQFSETIIREEFYPTTRNGFLFPNGTASSPYVFIPPCWENNTRHDAKPTDMPLLTDQDGHVVQLPLCAYGVSEAFASSLGSLVSSFAIGNCSAYLDAELDTVDCNTGYSTPDNNFCISNIDDPLCRIDLWWLQNLYNSGHATFESISSVIENLALAITDSARAQAYPGVSLVPGTIWDSAVCTEFSWPWICFPASLIALTVISLVSISSATASQKDGSPVWKSSILPLLYSRVVQK